MMVLIQLINDKYIILMPSELINIPNSQDFLLIIVNLKHHNIVMEAILRHFLVLAKAFNDEWSLP